MIARLGRFLLIALVLLLAACRQCGQFLQVRLTPGEGVQALKTGVPVLAGLEEAKPAVLSYLLRRGNYEIVVHITPKSYVASETITIRSLDNKSVGLATLPAGEQACVSYTMETDGSIRMTWWGGKGCELRQAIKFRVLSADGKVTADERIPFEIFLNGNYCVADAP